MPSSTTPRRLKALVAFINVPVELYREKLENKSEGIIFVVIKEYLEGMQ
jgi:hypothetical protein